MATYANLYIDQGADYSAYITIEDAYSDPLDLTNFELVGQIRRTYKSDTAYDFTITKESPLNGEIKIELNSSTTGSMGDGRYVYDIYAEESGGINRFKVIEGIVEIVPGVTRNE